MPAAQSSPGAARRRGPRPRHTRDDVVRAAVAIADRSGLDAVTVRAVAGRLHAGVMSLYSYVPGKQALVYEMVEQASGELELPEPSGDWLADIRTVTGLQRELLLRHPWLIDALSHLQPLGPSTLSFLEFVLAALEPTGLPAGRRLEVMALLNGFVISFVRSELAGRAAPSDQEQAAHAARLGELLATGRYPRFAAALAESGPPLTDLTGHFERLVDQIAAGLIQPAADPGDHPGTRHR